MDVLTSLNHPVIDWHPSWMTKKADGTFDEADDTFQPQQTKFDFIHNIEGRREKITAHVAPDNEASLEYFLTFTWEQFNGNYVPQLPANLQRNGPTLFSALQRFLQGSAKVIWHEVLEENGVNNADAADGTNDTSHENFMTCVQDYIEKRAGFPNVGDAIIHFVEHRKKPAVEANSSLC
jgi:hypothetical protein